MQPITLKEVRGIIDKAITPASVIKPAHYARWAMEPIEFIAINDLPWWAANVLKYIMRFDAKDGLQDLYKARSYLEMKIRQLEGETHFWEEPVQRERFLKQGAGPGVQAQAACSPEQLAWGSGITWY